MTSYDAQQKANMEIIDCLLACGLIDGVTLLCEGAPQKDDGIKFWRITPVPEYGAEQTYITYEISRTPESQNNTRADNQIAAFSFVGNIDIFTRLNLTDKTIMPLIADICQKLQDRGYLVTAGPDIYEYDTGISHKPIELEKEIF